MQLVPGKWIFSPKTHLYKLCPSAVLSRNHNITSDWLVLSLNRIMLNVPFSNLTIHLVKHGTVNGLEQLCNRPTMVGLCVFCQCLLPPNIGGLFSELQNRLHIWSNIHMPLKLQHSLVKCIIFNIMCILHIMCVFMLEMSI